MPVRYCRRETHRLARASGSAGRLRAYALLSDVLPNSQVRTSRADGADDLLSGEKCKRPARHPVSSGDDRAPP